MFGEGEGKGKKQQKSEQDKTESQNWLLNKRKQERKTFMSVFIHAISS